MQAKYVQKLAGGAVITGPPLKLYPHGFVGAPQRLWTAGGRGVGVAGACVRGAGVSGRGVAVAGSTVGTGVGETVGGADGAGELRAVTGAGTWAAVDAVGGEAVTVGPA